MSNETAGILPSILRLDLSIIADRASRKLGLEKATAHALILELKRYYTLCALNPDEHLVPWIAVDEVWHLHILDTRRYAHDCSTSIGQFLHHVPSDETPEERSLHEASFEKTRRLHKQLFGFDIPSKERQDDVSSCGPGSFDDRAPQASCGTGACSE